MVSHRQPLRNGMKTVAAGAPGIEPRAIQDIKLMVDTIETPQPPSITQ
jgi:hypothetical protein